MDYAVLFVTAATIVALLILVGLVVATPKADSVPNDVKAMSQATEVVTVIEDASTESAETAIVEQQLEGNSRLDSDSVELVPTDDEPSLVSENSELKTAQDTIGNSRWGLSFRLKKVSSETETKIAEQKPAKPTGIKKSFRWNRTNKKGV